MYKQKNVYFIIFCLLMSLALLGACNTTATHEANSEEDETENVRYYESEKGTVELPLEPSRVVVSVRDYVGDVLAMGVKPVGVSETMVFDAPYYQEQLKGVESVGEDTAISLEKITSLNPDLIITYTEDSYEQSSKIAPTVLIPYGELNYEERLLEFGKILNKETEAQQRLEQFQEKVKDKKVQLSDTLEQDTKVAIVEITDKDLYVFGKTYGRGGEILYNQLELAAPKKVEEVTEAEGWASISLETIPEYLGEADYILMGVRDTGSDKKAEIQSSKLWTELSAVKEGKVYEYDLASFYFQDVIALDYQLDLLVEFFQSNEKVN
ncbi:iron complex transport system substrate-binding protein [Gracilibacillus orientalis]|uniref:Iron complex transport system substrate-binding protein n=1 Tax=Gracilibacillus orientalis TaxID=334253 RepID=A0A1I4LJN5_9BACI|nr:ABC transporter substrate-binding protein [Gracilibacillus orientalis]SFL91182.1 iron complex transport system substrate-binding protein [Gracilibacillus orientalis]